MLIQDAVLCFQVEVWSAEGEICRGLDKGVLGIPKSNFLGV